MIIAEGAPYIYEGNLVYIYKIEGATAKIVGDKGGTRSVYTKDLKPAFHEPEYKWKLEDLFIDINTSVVCNNGKDMIPWSEWISKVYNPHIAVQRMTEVLPFGVYKGILYTMDFLKEKMNEYVDMLELGR